MDSAPVPISDVFSPARGVFLNIYDVVQPAAEEVDQPMSATVITRINKITRDWGLGGVFHGAVQIDNYEWSFGYCEKGTGVYCVKATANPMYQFRETLDLGPTLKTKQEIKAILQTLKVEWPGSSYDLLSRNCCHFCEAFVEMLGVKPIPAWVNRFAVGADATVAFTQDVVATARSVTHTISSSAAVSFSWLKDRVGKIIPRPGSNSGHDNSSTSPPSTTSFLASRASHPAAHHSAPNLEQHARQHPTAANLLGRAKGAFASMNGTATAALSAAAQSIQHSSSSETRGTRMGLHIGRLGQREVAAGPLEQNVRAGGSGRPPRPPGNSSSNSGWLQRSPCKDLGSVENGVGAGDAAWESGGSERDSGSSLGRVTPVFARSGMGLQGAGGEGLWIQGRPSFGVDSDERETPDAASQHAFHRQACLDLTALPAGGAQQHPAPAAAQPAANLLDPYAQLLPNLSDSDDPSSSQGSGSACGSAQRGRVTDELVIAELTTLRQVCQSSPLPTVCGPDMTRVAVTDALAISSTTLVAQQHTRH